jgi:hypothetical protein
MAFAFIKNIWKPKRQGSKGSSSLSELSIKDRNHGSSFPNYAESKIHMG